jgi:hypothetical protein
MELLMPSLIALLLAVAIAYFVIPQLAPSVLMIVSALVLAWAVFSHATRFGVTEYERATWMYKIGEYSGIILFGVILFIGYGLFMMQGQSGSGASNTSILTGGPTMPNLTMPSVGGGFGTVYRTVRSRLGELARKGRISLD